MDPRGMFWASLSFAWGGLILLAAALVPFFILVCGLWVVIGLYLVGWVHLARAVRAHRPIEERFLLTIGFVVAPFAGFTVSLALLPLFVPVDGWWPIFVFYGAFLYVPTCWTPILVAHGAMLLVASRGAGLRARPLLAVAGAALLELAAVGVVAQSLWTSLPPGILAPLFALLPGLTGPAYGLATLGWWRELSVSGGLLRRERMPLAAPETERR